MLQLRLSGNEFNVYQSFGFVGVNPEFFLNLELAAKRYVQVIILVITLNKSTIKLYIDRKIHFK